MIFRSAQGFTLVEILIVIGIMGILATALALNTYQGSVKHARDARRISDMQSIQNALEQCYSLLNSQYPTLVPFASPMPCSNTTVLNPVPVDPNNSKPNVTPYIFSTQTSSQYCGCANLEIKTPNSNDANCTFIGITPSPDGGGYYCIKNVQ